MNKVNCSQRTSGNSTFRSNDALDSGHRLAEYRKLRTVLKLRAKHHEYGEYHVYSNQIIMKVIVQSRNNLRPINSSCTGGKDWVTIKCEMSLCNSKRTQNEREIQAKMGQRISFLGESIIPE